MKIPNSFALIYCDGSALGNPGPAGFAAYVQYFYNRRCIKDRWIAGCFRVTTNNRAELWSLIYALNSLPDSVELVEVFMDSRYVVEAISQGWVFKWVVSGKSRPNLDLWEKVYVFMKRIRIVPHWVEGHSSYVINVLCDSLARQMAEFAERHPLDAVDDPGFLD